MNSKISISLLLSIACSFFGAYADVPQGYYDACKGKNKGALKSQLHSIIKNHSAISYGSSTWEAFKYTDVDPTGTYWMDIYTHEQVSISGHDGMNIEHTFPKSWWGGSNNNAYKDITHLMPVDQWANNDRSNHPFGEVDPSGIKAPNYRCESPNYTLGRPVSGQGGDATYVFEPADEFKGDMARTYFYMVTCYQDLTWANDGLRTCAQGTYPTLQPWAIDMLLRWHRDDPVSDKERKRNEGVYSRQHSRNPFIDHPEMAEFIWGNMMDQGWDNDVVIPDNPPTPELSTLTAPLDGDVTTFEASMPGESVTHIIPVLGKGFNHSLLASISGTDASLYTIMLGSTPLPSLTLAADDVNAEDGIELLVRYTPQEATLEGERHIATLTLSGRDMEKDVTVELSGTCLAASIEIPEVNTTGSENFFTIDGRKLPGKPSLPGIYIMVIDGKTHKFLNR